jgi:hypothetical protein
MLPSALNNNRVMLAMHLFKSFGVTALELGDFHSPLTYLNMRSAQTVDATPFCQQIAQLEPRPRRRQISGGRSSSFRACGRGVVCSKLTRYVFDSIADIHVWLVALINVSSLLLDALCTDLMQRLSVSDRRPSSELRRSSPAQDDAAALAGDQHVAEHAVAHAAHFGLLDAQNLCGTACA